jgi:hypothetical protein
MLIGPRRGSWGCDSGYEQFDAGIFSVDAAALEDERCGLELTGNL